MLVISVALLSLFTDFLDEIKIRVVTHYTAILGLMERKYKGEEQNLTSNLNIQSIVLRKLDFLTAPVR